MVRKWHCQKGRRVAPVRVLRFVSSGSWFFGEIGPQERGMAVAARTAVAGVGTVLVVQGQRPWPDSMLGFLVDEGYTVIAIDHSREIPFFVLAGGVRAVLLDDRGLGLTDRLALSRCRIESPSTAVVVIAMEGAPRDVARALESGASAFLTWPSPPDVVRQALRSGEQPQP